MYLNIYPFMVIRMRETLPNNTKTEIQLYNFGAIHHITRTKRTENK